MSSRPSVPAEFCAAFARLVADIVASAPDLPLSGADVQAVLRGAAGLAIGQAEASGPGRALRALTAAQQARQVVGHLPGLRGRVLLAVASRPDAEVDLDELTALIEALQPSGSEWEMIFGYGTAPTLSAELRLTILLASTYP